MKETVKKYARRYFIKAMGSMALGLFASLLIGTIFQTVGKYLGEAYVASAFLNEIGAGFTEIAVFTQKYTAGAAIGVAIAYSLEASPLVTFSAATVGYAGYALGAVIDGVSYTAGPLGAFVAVIVAVEIGMLVSGKTKVDILVSPVVTIAVGYIVARLVCPGVAYLMYWLGEFIGAATYYAPLVMGLVIGAVVGMVLTLPISSAAICAILFSPAAIELSSNRESLLLAGGAAAVGCCCQMVGFAVMSFRENGWNGIVSQGIGTSMLQMGNIVKNPRIWIPPTVASALAGALSTTVFRLQCTGVAAGMGTCGMVGVLGIVADTPFSPRMWIGTALLCLVLPAVVSLGLGEVFRRIGWIKENDLTL